MSYCRVAILCRTFYRGISPGLRYFSSNRESRLGNFPSLASAGNEEERSTQVNPERWQEVMKVLAATLEREAAKRPAYLDQVCLDPSLRREVESLIAAHEQG